MPGCLNQGHGLYRDPGHQRLGREAADIPHVATRVLLTG